MNDEQLVCSLLGGFPIPCKLHKNGEVSIREDKYLGAMVSCWTCVLAYDISAVIGVGETPTEAVADWNKKQQTKDGFDIIFEELDKLDRKLKKEGDPRR